MIAQVKWPDVNNAQRDGISGIVTITQDNRNSPAHYKVKLNGLTPNSLHGFHIHESPVTCKSDLEKTCETCGGHFNPTNNYHGSVLNNQPKLRHAGDLINNVYSDFYGKVDVEFDDNLATLIYSNSRPYTILGKSLVVHEGVDDLGRLGRHERTPFIDGFDSIVYFDNTNNSFTYYSNHELMTGSLKTGNAGKRLACGNIVKIN
jgi:Cu/Zn superoxide dismutase